jgi:hypothetical protein
VRASATMDATNQTPDCNRRITDLGYNLDSDGSCRLRAVGSRSHAAADLGRLANNFGATDTVLPGLHSAARNAIPFGKAGCVKGAKDQRNVPLPQPKGGKCDIGAVEVKVTNPKLSATVVGHKNHGLYRGRVTVRYQCTLGSAPLRHKCPAPTHLHSVGRHHIKTTIHAEDGGTAKVRLLITIK